MASSDEENSGGGVILDGPFDPDAQATVSDYVDYTEYLPADVIRSLTLIRGLDGRYLEATQAVHGSTKEYGLKSGSSSSDSNNLQNLRRDISHDLDRAINARESAYGEACRLFDVVDRHFDRLDCIRRKLRAIPPPPEVVPHSGTRKKKGNINSAGDDDDGGPTTRITLRLDNKRLTVGGNRHRAAITAQHHRNVHPDSPIASTEPTDEEIYLPRGTGGTRRLAHKQGARDKKQRPKPAAAARRALGSTPAQKSGPAQRGSHRTQVAGISTSKALALLKPPSEDAKPGGPELPWLRLTEWEMAALRKKMKKNAIWKPSEVMEERELAARGRGWEGYRAAKAEADANGTEVLDCDDIMNAYVEGELTQKKKDGVVARGATKTTTTSGNNSAEKAKELSNRGMKLNAAKRIKREHLAREQAKEQAGVAASLNGIRMPAGPPAPAPAPEMAKSSKKRKLPGEAEPPRPTGRKTNAAPARLKLRTASTLPASQLRSATAGRASSLHPATTMPPRNQGKRPGVPPPPLPAEAQPLLRRKKTRPTRSQNKAIPKGGGPSSSTAPVHDETYEQVDPDEPRYCICGDVSFGVMICCENDDVGVLFLFLFLFFFGNEKNEN